MGVCTSNSRKANNQGYIMVKTSVINISTDTKATNQACETPKKDTNQITSPLQTQTLNNSQNLKINSSLLKSPSKNDKHNTNEVVRRQGTNFDYFLICPQCKIQSPKIENIFYDDKSEDFLVKYSCKCNIDDSNLKIVPLVNILSNNKPLNYCGIHKGNKLTNYCTICKKGVCGMIK